MPRTRPPRNPKFRAQHSTAQHSTALTQLLAIDLELGVKYTKTNMDKKTRCS